MMVWKLSLNIFLLLIIASCLAQDEAKDVVKTKVIIVGAGAAGLHSAYKLSEKGVTDVVVLEAQERIGGRIHSNPINGDWIEFGAQWIHGRENNPLWLFCQEKKIPISLETSRAGEGTFIRVDDGKEIPDAILEQTVEAFEEFADNSVCNDEDEEDDEEDEEDEEEKEQEESGEKNENPESVGDLQDIAFKNWLATETAGDDKDTVAWRKQLFRWWQKVEQFDSATSNLYNLSANSYCQYDQILPDTTLLNGYQSVIDVWKDALTAKNVPMLTNSKVNTIRWQSADGKVTVKTEDGKTYEADHVIVTVSLGYLKKHQSGLFVPSLPEEKVTVIDTIKFGTTDKIFLEFEKPFWDPKDPGFMFLWAGDENDEEQVVDETNWVRHILGFDGVLRQPNMLLGWVAGQGAKYIESLSDEEISAGILNHLTEVMRKWKADPDFELPELKQIIVTRWNSNPYFLGSYSYSETDSDVLGISHSNLSVPLIYNDAPKVLFAGEATTDEYFSAVHGAMQSAVREVDRLTDYLSR